MAEHITIYLVDDDADDRLLFTEAIRIIEPAVLIIESQNGQELLNILESQPVSDKSLIVLDINMPIMNGLETLAKLRSHTRLDFIPAVILSTSCNPEMIKLAKGVGAANCFVKPNTMEGILNLFRELIFKKLEKF